MIKLHFVVYLNFCFRAVTPDLDPFIASDVLTKIVTALRCVSIRCLSVFRPKLTLTQDLERWDLLLIKSLGPLVFQLNSWLSPKCNNCWRRHSSFLDHCRILRFASRITGTNILPCSASSIAPSLSNFLSPIGVRVANTFPGQPDHYAAVLLMFLYVLILLQLISVNYLKQHMYHVTSQLLFISTCNSRALPSWLVLANAPVP